MKVALITTPPSVRSGIGDYTRHLLPYLREHCDVDLFVESDPTWEGEDVRVVDQLRPRDYDQILYQLGNEQSHAFMVRMIRAIGGTVMQHDWVLFDMAMATFPGLVRGGTKGHLLALREGGLRQAGIYSRNWADRRRQRNRPSLVVDASGIEGTLLSGWYEPERGGRWTSDRAFVRIPGAGVERVEVGFHPGPGRLVSVHQNGSLLAEGADGELIAKIARGDRPLVSIETRGIRVTPEQRAHGDNRRLGVYVNRIAWKGREGSGEVDLEGPCAQPNRPITLSRDRFRLSLNRSVVRFADAFIVHSDYVRKHILEERNTRTPIGVLHHGAEFRMRDEARRETRRRLELPEEWLDSFVVTSFGGVQAHKRIDKALEALAQARRERADIRMILAGSLAGEFDPRAMARHLGLEEAVRFTGFVTEEKAWDWLHAGDIALNLRGPSTGGTSGGLFQAFSVGRPVIASDAAEQRELPDSCVLKIPLGEDEIPTLARTFVALRDDPERRAALEREVLEFVEKECHWGIVARRYAEYLERFPHARASRRGLLAMKLASRRGS